MRVRENDTKLPVLFEGTVDDTQTEQAMGQGCKMIARRLQAVYSEGIHGLLTPMCVHTCNHNFPVTHTFSHAHHNTSPLHDNLKL